MSENESLAATGEVNDDIGDYEREVRLDFGVREGHSMNFQMHDFARTALTALWSRGFNTSDVAVRGNEDDGLGYVTLTVDVEQFEYERKICDDIWGPWDEGELLAAASTEKMWDCVRRLLKRACLSASVYRAWMLLSVHVPGTAEEDE